MFLICLGIWFFIFVIVCILFFIARRTKKPFIPPPPLVPSFTWKPLYSFCESEISSGRSPWHIRKLTDAGLKLDGGVDTSSLCGYVTRGWDLNVPITDHHLRHCCPICEKAYKRIMENQNG